MALVHWQALSEIERMRHQFDRMFGELAGFETSPQLNLQPAIELSNGDDSFTLKVELPGMKREDLDISLTHDIAVIRGERRYENIHHSNSEYLSEFGYGRFERTVRLPEPIQNDQAQANYENGILTLNLPKAEESRSRVFKVNLEPTNRGIEAASSEATDSSSNS